MSGSRSFAGVSSRLGWVDVTDSRWSGGAKGDGVTDDAAAIQAAIDALPAGGGTVLLPPGTYLVGATLNMPMKPWTLRGSGMRATKIKQQNGANLTSVIDYAGSAPPGGVYVFSNFDYLKISDLEVDGNKSNNASSTQGIRLFNGDYITINNLSVVNCTRFGLTLSGCDEVSVTGSFFTGNGTTAGTDGGLYCTGGAHDMTISGCGIETNVGAGIFFNGAFESAVVNCNTWKNTYGIRLGATAVDNVIVGNVLEFDQSHGILLEASTVRNIVTNNRIKDPVTDGIKLTNSTFNRIAFNIISGCGGRAINETGTSDSNVFVWNETGSGNTSANAIIGANSVDAATTLIPGQALGTKFKSGRYYAAHSTILSTGQPTNGQIVLSPLWVPSTVTVDRIGIETTVAGSTGALCRLGIYSSDSNGDPSTLVLDGGTFDGTQTPGAYEVTVSQQLRPGLYWLSYTPQGAPTTTPTIRTVAANVAPVGFTSAPSAGANNGGYRAVETATGALPSTVSVTAHSGNAPRCYVRIA